MTDDGRPPLEASGLKLQEPAEPRWPRAWTGSAQRGLPKELTRLRAILAKGLEATAALWPDVRVAFGWVHRAAAVLRNKKGLDAAGVRRRYRGLIAAIARHRRAAGRLAEAFAHFLKVTRSYWPGLFRCYEVAGLPRTNNELEQFFGSYRYHERRCQRSRRSPARGRWCAARCGWWRRPRPGCGRSSVADLVPARPGAHGGSCAVAGAAASRCGRWAAASAVIRWPTCDRLRRP